MSGTHKGGLVLAVGAAVVLVVGGGAVAVQELTSDSTPVAASTTVQPSGSILDPDPSGSPAPATSPTRSAPVAAPRAPVPHRVGSPKPTGKTSTPATSKKKTTSAPAATGGMSALERQVLALTNTERGKQGCAPLRGDSRLANAARAHSTDMAVRKYFDHNSQDGTSPWTRIKRAGYSQPGAENIAMGQPTPAAVMKAWMNSPGHRANILNCKLKALGVGVHTGSGGPWWTQDFGWI